MIEALVFLIYSLVLFVTGFGFGAMAVLVAIDGREVHDENFLPGGPPLHLVVDNTPRDAA